MQLERDGKYLVLATTNPAKWDRVKGWLTYPSQTNLPPPSVAPLVVEDLEELSTKVTGTGCLSRCASVRAYLRLPLRHLTIRGVRCRLV